MPLPPLHLQPVSTTHYYISGDVTIHAGAAIAPGVLLQADPDSRVIIQAGACIGIGSILHAHQGVVEVGEGANIGAEVLLIGQVTIGARACVGSASTIINGTIAWGQIVPPGSLIGDASLSHPEPSEPPPATPALEATETVILPSAPPESAASEASGVNVYGQVYVNQLLVKMFPNHQKSAPPPAADPWDD